MPLPTCPACKRPAGYVYPARRRITITAKGRRYLAAMKKEATVA